MRGWGGRVSGCPGKRDGRCQTVQGRPKPYDKPNERVKTKKINQLWR